jgi:hypothetical protein
MVLNLKSIIEAGISPDRKHIFAGTATIAAHHIRRVANCKTDAGHHIEK